jgi:hypothetical protein
VVHVAPSDFFPHEPLAQVLGDKHALLSVHEPQQAWVAALQT